MVSLIIGIALLGLLVWVIQTLVPMPPKFQQVIYVIAVVIAIFMVLKAFNLLPAGINIH